MLLVNRLPPRRFLLCLASGWLVFLGSALLWAGSLWLFLPLPLSRCVALVALAHAPLLLGFLTLVPHFGAYLFHGLRAWVLFDLVVAVGVTTEVSLTTAILCCLPGWLLHFWLTHLRLVRLERFQSWLWRRLT